MVDAGVIFNVVGQYGATTPAFRIILLRKINILVKQELRHMALTGYYTRARIAVTLKCYSSVQKHFSLEI